MAPPEVTVVVPVRDRRDRMLRCLDGLLGQDHPSFEILVLDNDSTDGTADACRARAAEGRVPVRVEVVAGSLGAVRNAGARLARGRYLAFTDSDCIPDPGWIRAATRELDRDPGLGCVCGRTLPEEPPRAWAHTVRVEGLTGRFESCNLVVRADAFRAGSGFDERVGDGWEDTVVGYDLARRGWRSAYVPQAVVLHDVTYPGFWHHVRREQRQRNAAHAVARFPEIRRRLLFARVFLHPRAGASFAAGVGLALGRRWPQARWLALPYVPYLLRRGRPWRMVQIVVLDAAMHVAVLRGAIRSRRLLL